jgi:aryl-alcohol dehydrogenase-like predicted oxidoreductase
MPNLVLGTANFGNAYGIGNNGASLSNEESKYIIEWAQANRVNYYDTAMAYGSAEKILGIYLDKSLEPNVSAKLNEESCQTSDLIVQRTKEILARLGMSRLSVLYLHNEALLGTSIGPEIKRGLEAVLDLGLAEKIGVSAYSEESVFSCKKKVPKLTAFQVPENICDRRLIHSQKILELAAHGNSFQVRSIFLQGLLLMDPKKLPHKLTNTASGIQQLREFGDSYSISTVELCLAYAKSIPWADGIVVGVASLKQLQEIVSANRPLPLGWDSGISILPEDILDPRKWKL